MSGTPLLEVSLLVKTYRLRRAGLFARQKPHMALDGVSFSMERGRSFGVVGESGSGKSTLARIALALDRPDSGTVRLLGRSLFDMPRRELRAARADMQMVFQDPNGSLDPRQRVERIVAEPLAAQGGATKVERRARVESALEAVGLKASDTAKYPHEFSGGQRQRIAMARALITRPSLVVADEPVSALDVSVQAQILNLMSDLEREAGVTFLLISHDLAVVAHICAVTAVMYKGRIVERGETADLLAKPAHPYTRELIDATPRLDQPTGTHAPPPSEPHRFPQRRTLSRGPQGSDGCPYAIRCAFAGPRCLTEPPVLKANGDATRKVACHFPLD